MCARISTPFMSLCVALRKDKGRVLLMCTNQKYYVPLDQKGVDFAEYINKPSFLLGLLV